MCLFVNWLGPIRCRFRIEAKLGVDAVAAVANRAQLRGGAARPVSVVLFLVQREDTFGLLFVDAVGDA